MGGDHDQTMTGGGVCDAAAYIHDKIWHFNVTERAIVQLIELVAPGSCRLPRP